MDVFWTKGVDPGSYFGLPTLSFYLPELDQLYILGGVNGDVDSSDTDHFDSSIILHEYAHVLEDYYSISDSPGGIHNGDNILDPRLAWSEGWANYFQAAVTGDPVYRDTSGTPLGTAITYVDISLETIEADATTEAEEGNFREFAVSRALVDITDSNNEGANDDLQTDFDELWTLFAGTSSGFASSAQSFRSIGLFYELQSTLSGGSNWTTIIAAEDQIASRKNYATPLMTGSSCPVTILAEDVPNASVLNNPGRQPEDGTSANSNQFKSNDFYEVNHPGGSITINMTYSTTGGNAADLDIYLYKEGYTYGDASSDSIAAYSETTQSISAGTGAETISLSYLAGGTYLLNVVYDTTNGIRSSADYNLSVSSLGGSVCPNP